MVGAVVVAAVAIVAGLVAASGGDDDPGPGTTPTTDRVATTVTTTPPRSTTTVFPFSAAQQALLSHIPAEIRNTNRCDVPPRTAVFESFASLPYIRCTVRVGANNIYAIYYQVDSRSRMDAQYDGQVRRLTLPSGSCDPDVTTTFTATGTYSAGSSSATAGRLLCYVDSDGDPWLHWTDNATNIYVHAYATGPDDTEDLGIDLHQFWKDAGPD